MEPHHRAGAVTGPDDLEVLFLLASVESLEICLSVVGENSDLQPVREGVYNRCSDSVKSAGEMVSFSAELSARMQDRVHYRDCGKSDLGLDAYRYSPSVIGYFDDLTGEYPHVDLVAVTRQSFVYGVVDYLVYEVMKSRGSGGTDIHTGAFADGLKSFQYLDVAGVVALFFSDLFLTDR